IQRLGFDYAAVSAREPRLLYVSISGFGQTGPLAERPAMDPVLQAYTGLMAENRGEDGIPHRVPVIVVDMSTALYAFQAVSAALYAIVRPAIAAKPSAHWSERLTRARLMHERLNSYADFLEQPHVRQSGLIQWLGQAGLDRPVPVPALPGMLPQADGTPRGTA